MSNEHITKYNIDGIQYLDLRELDALIRQMKKDAREGVKPGYINKNKNECMAAMLALNHLQAVIHMDESRARFHRMVAENKAKRAREENEDRNKYVVFTMRGDLFQFVCDFQNIEDLPEYIRKHLHNRDDREICVVTCNNIDDAFSYDSEYDAKKAAKRANRLVKDGTEYHVAKRLMFETKENREALYNLFGEATEKVEPKEKIAVPARYTVARISQESGKKPKAELWLVRFEDGMPIFSTDRKKAMWFRNKAMANNAIDMVEKIKGCMGCGWCIVDMNVMLTAEERLLRAIFDEDEDDKEDDYCGDGVSAEDEDWDGDDDGDE